MIFLPRFWAIIWASTRTPATAGAPTITSAPCPTSCTLVTVTVSPTAPVSFSTSIVSPGLTRYCRPPVVITAYIPYPLPSGTSVPHPSPCHHCRHFVRPGAYQALQKWVVNVSHTEQNVKPGHRAVLPYAVLRGLASAKRPGRRHRVPLGGSHSSYARRLRRMPSFC